MTTPERISISPTYNQKRDDDYYLVDRDAFPGKGTEYIRADIADARVAAAYEAAAREADDYMEPHVANGIRALTPDDAKAALEQVRREARRNALLDAVAACRPHADDCALDRQAKAQCADMIQRLLDNPQEDKT
ncbi:hypothetical protein KC887_08735 [Candidatus Kaiserbacteria bacterium]|nr:hypothetical protein [Candidatus Kaiserbacteria bacterium]